MTINSQAKGKRAERDVVGWLKLNGWPDARRHVRTGDRFAPDEGDIRLPGVVLEVKHYAGGLTEGEVVKFLSKLEAQQCQPGEVGILIERRERCTDVGRWWAWLALGALSQLTGGHRQTWTSPVRLHLSVAMSLARLRPVAVALTNPFLDGVDL